MSYETERERPGREPCQILELYVPLCQLRYGETTAAGTCPAVLGTDSADKCYNTLATCAVPDSYTPADQVFRWSTAQQAIPPSFRVRPTIVKVDAAPRRIAPSKGLGEAAEARITVIDHPWGDVWEDPYRDERAYDPVTQGTYWPKWLARNPYHRGIRMRLLDGYVSPDGFSLDDFAAREYILDAVKGPDRREQVTIIGTDIFRLLEKDRSVVPAPNTGVLAAAIDEAATSFTLSPTGIGDEEYAASFRCVIGNEGFDVTRVGDTCTVVARGLYRGLDEHEAEDAVQVVRVFAGQRVDEIAAAIITEAQPDLTSYIPTADWEAEATDFLPRLYSADIVKPTGVNELLAELMDSVPVIFWPNEHERRIEMRAIKPPPGTRPTFTDAEHFIAGSLSKEDRPKDRVDAVLVYFGQLDPTEDRNKASNYAQAYYYVGASDYGTHQLREVFSRWISRFAKAHAEDLAKSYVYRYRETPVTLKFHLDAKHGDNWTGDVFRADTRRLQGPTGANAQRNFQIIEAFEKTPGHLIEYEAESYDWWLEDDDYGNEIVIYFSVNDTDINLRDVYDSLYSQVAPKIRFVVEASIRLGGASADAAVYVGDWPENPDIRLDIYGAIIGQGGKGGDNPLSTAAEAGEDGKTALYTRYPIQIYNAGGLYGGGGGGGAGMDFSEGPFANSAQGGAGGGGAGYLGGPGGVGVYEDTSGEDGGTTGGLGGTGRSYKQYDAGDGGKGGEYGMPGEQGEGAYVVGVWEEGYPGGAAGDYLDGESYVTWIDADGNATTDRGDVRGGVV